MKAKGVQFGKGHPYNGAQYIGSTYGFRNQNLRSDVVIKHEGKLITLTIADFPGRNRVKVTTNTASWYLVAFEETQEYATF